MFMISLKNGKNLNNKKVYNLLYVDRVNYRNRVSELRAER